MKYTRLFAALLFLQGFVPTTAHADDKRSVDIARRRFNEGREQYRKGDLEGSRLSFSQSYAAWPAVETIRALALAELDTGHFVDAVKHFKQYARDKNADPEFLKEVPKLIEKCNGHLGQVRIEAPPGATILVDGHRVYDVHEPLDLDPGTHTVTLHEPAPSETRDVTVRVMQTTDVSFVKARPASDSASAPSLPPSEIVPAIEPPSTTLSEGFWTTRNTWVVGLGAGAVVSAAIGTGFGIAAMNDKSSYDDFVAKKDPAFCSPPSSSAQCRDVASTSSDQRSAATVSIAAFGVSAALVVGALAVWALPKRDDRRSGRVWFAPALGGASNGFVAAGRF